MTKLLKQTHESPIKPVNGSRKLFEPELSSGSNRRTTFVPRVSLPFRAFPRVYIYRTPRATPTFPITARRQARKMEENRGARAKLAAASPPKGSPHLPLRPAKWRAREQRNTFTREGKGSGIITGRLYLGYTGGFARYFRW